jgi:predicted Zn-dependent protease
MKSTILIHLHPDFSHELKDVLKRWNIVQHEIEFVGIRPKHKWESSLLSSGEISDDEASTIAAKIRAENGFSPDDGILVFTEKRLYNEDYYQLFVGGREADEIPPRVGILSLQFLRNFYKSPDSRKSLIFRAIILNILYNIAVDEGLNDHGSVTKGCIMDFCGNMSDIEIGLANGPKFCSECTSIIEQKGETYLFELVNSFLVIPDLEAQDSRITEAVLQREDLYKDEKDAFDYDVALSFAGEDRNCAEQIAQGLKRLNVKVFYDKFEQAKLWGRQLHIYLTDLYRLRARYCIIFVSENYKKKRWTNLELKAALARALKGNEDYILPIRLDNTEIAGILPTQCFLNWHEESVENIIQFVKEKLNEFA